MRPAPLTLWVIQDSTLDSDIFILFYQSMYSYFHSKIDIQPSYGRWFQIHRKIPISKPCHIVFRILNNKIRCTLTNLKPTWKILNGHPITSQLINSSITLLIKFACECRKIFPFAVRKSITILKPGWNAGPSDMLHWRCSWIRLSNSISLWARSLRLWKTGPAGGPLPASGIGEIREEWMRRWVESIGHWHHWQGRLRLCGGRTVMSAVPVTEKV